MLWHNHCSAQMCLLIGTVSQVRDVAHGPHVLGQSFGFIEEHVLQYLNIDRGQSSNVLSGNYSLFVSHYICSLMMKCIFGWSDL